MTNEEKIEAPPPSRYTRTVDLRPRVGEMMKPGEMIDIRGIEGLTLRDLTIYNQLIENAFGPEMAERDYQWTIAVSELRGTHKGNERVSETINKLMRTVCSTRLVNGKTRRFQLLGGNDMDDEDRPDGRLTYSFDWRLAEVLRDSFTFGKLELRVMRAFASKYSLALYEFGAKRVNLEFKVHEVHSLEDFRGILGVPEDKLVRFCSLKQKAIDPALVEVNALANFTLWVKPKKTGRKVTHVAIGWDWKNEEDRAEAFQELQRPRVGRKARITGQAERIEIAA